MENMTLQEQIRHVKLHLRGVMNGVVSQSMREKGLTYKLNFGVDLPRLRLLANEFPHTATLAAALWKEDIRECRLLAAMLYPAEEYPEELADLWIEQMKYTEEAECTVLHLFSHLPYASNKVFEWIAQEQTMFQICGWLLLGRLLSSGKYLCERDVQEIFDQMETALMNEDKSVVIAAQKTLIKLMDCGPKEEKQGEKLLEKIARQKF